MELIGEDFPESNCVLLRCGHSGPMCILPDVVVVFVTHPSVQCVLYILTILSCKNQCVTLNTLEKEKNPQLYAGYLQEHLACPARCACLWLFHSSPSGSHFYCPLSGLVTGIGWGVSSLNAFTILCGTEVSAHLKSLWNAVLWSLHLKSEGISEMLTVIFESTRNAHE